MISHTIQKRDENVQLIYENGRSMKNAENDIFMVNIKPLSEILREINEMV